MTTLDKESSYGEIRGKMDEFARGLSDAALAGSLNRADMISAAEGNVYALTAMDVLREESTRRQMLAARRPNTDEMDDGEYFAYVQSGQYDADQTARSPYLHVGSDPELDALLAEEEAIERKLRG